MSVRSRLETQAAGKERLAPPDIHRATGMTSFYDNVQTSVRGRGEHKRAQQQAQAEESKTTGGLGVGWYGELLAEEKAREEAKLKEQQAREAQEQAQRAAQQKTEGERHLWLMSVNAAFDTVRATDAERARILSLPIAVVGTNPDKLAGAVLTLRDATRGKPDWAKSRF
jgi:hypothetical protein